MAYAEEVATVIVDAMPLTLLPPPITRDDALTRQLDRIGARLRRTIVLRSGSWLIALSILFIGGLASLDHRFHLPAFVRGLGLVAYLVAIPILYRRWISRPLDGSNDLVRIALRVERAYPEFNDSLVSAVHFLQRSPRDRTSSPGLRRAAIRRASRKAERYEFDRAVDTYWLKRSMLAAMLVAAGAAWLGFAYADAAKTALLRIALPFSGAVAPTKTHIHILAPQPLPHRMARGEPLDIRIALSGVIPDRVAVGIQLDGGQPSEQSYAVLPGDGSSDAAELTVRIEPSRIPREFLFRIRA